MTFICDVCNCQKCRNNVSNCGECDWCNMCTLHIVGGLPRNECDDFEIDKGVDNNDKTN